MAIAFNIRYASMRQDPRADTPAPTPPRASATPARATARVDDRMHARMDARVDNGRAARAGGDAAPRAAAGGFWGKDGFTFDDVLDLINPLQHIPVVGAIYRAATGDGMAPGARVLGGALYGGIAGLASGVVNAIVAETTGGDIGAHAIALLGGGNEDGDAPARVLAASAPIATTGTTAAAKAGTTAAATAATPTWLSYIPQARESQAVLAARYANAGLDATPKVPPNTPPKALLGKEAAGRGGANAGQAAAGILDAMTRALDKYEAAGGLLPKDGGARKPSVDSLL